MSLVYILLNFKRYVKVKYFLFFMIIFGNLIASSLALAKLLLTKINISLVYILIIFNKLDRKKR